MPRRAFTLVELLVVIAIIGLLSSVAVVSLNGARSKARNAKRAGDIRQYAAAFELGYSDVGSYPASSNACISSVCTGTWSGQPSNATVDAFIAPYLSPKPTDPADGGRGVSGYIYNGSWGGGTGLDGAFPAGSMLDYNLEGAVSCPLGKRWYSSALLTECVYTLNR